MFASMEKALEEIVARIDALMEEDEDRGRSVAHDLVDQLVARMESLAFERAELETKLLDAGKEPDDRTALVEEVAARLEETAGRARLTKELIDAVIERMYRLTPEQSASIAEATEEKK